MTHPTPTVRCPAGQLSASDTARMSVPTTENPETVTLDPNDTDTVPTECRICGEPLPLRVGTPAHATPRYATIWSGSHPPDPTPSGLPRPGRRAGSPLSWPARALVDLLPSPYGVPHRARTGHRTPTGPGRSSGHGQRRPSTARSGRAGDLGHAWPSHRPLRPGGRAIRGADLRAVAQRAHP
jgi:hypothetical protein